jgi:excisionase family DNA binding protein
MPIKTPKDVSEMHAGSQKHLNLMTLQEAAAYARVSISTLRRWVRDEGLAFYKAGRQIRIDETELVRFLSGTKSGLLNPPI